MIVISCSAFMSEENYDLICKKIDEQAEKGVILLPRGFKVEYIVDDAEVKIEED